MFVPYKKTGQPQPFEYFIVTTSESIALGEALVLSSGKLTKCGATTAPAFIALAALAAAATDRVIPVVRVEKNQVYEVTVTATPTSLNVGDKVTLHTDGAQITATTTNGVVTIVDTLGAAASGDAMLVRI